MQLRFTALAGDDVVCELPSEDSPDAASLIDLAATNLAAEYVHRRRKGAAAELTKWLRPLAYRLISACLDFDLVHLLYRRSLKVGHYKRGHPQLSNPFQLGLMAIFAEDTYFVKEDRYELGQILWYAYRHYVPLCFINGFASQIGQIDKRRSDNELEPEFTDWIIEHRLIDLRAHNPRGNYPDYIEQRVGTLRVESAGVLGRIFKALSEVEAPIAREASVASEDD